MDKLRASLALCSIFAGETLSGFRRKRQPAGYSGFSAASLVQPVQDHLEGQAHIANLAVVLARIGFGEDPGADRMRRGQCHQLVREHVERHVVVFGASQAASALAINAAALVTRDRDFSRVRSLRIIS